eukprot:scaffold18679_cov59-Phaeocystis_antarctica.AAC.4
MGRMLTTPAPAAAAAAASAAVGGVGVAATLMNSRPGLSRRGATTDRTRGLRRSSVPTGRTGEASSISASAAEVSCWALHCARSCDEGVDSPVTRAPASVSGERKAPGICSRATRDADGEGGEPTAERKKSSIAGVRGIVRERHSGVAEGEPLAPLG